MKWQGPDVAAREMVAWQGPQGDNDTVMPPGLAETIADFDALMSVEEKSTTMILVDDERVARLHDLSHHRHHVQRRRLHE